MTVDNLTNAVSISKLFRLMRGKWVVFFSFFVGSFLISSVLLYALSNSNPIYQTAIYIGDEHITRKLEDEQSLREQVISGYAPDAFKSLGIKPVAIKVRLSARGGLLLLTSEENDTNAQDIESVHRFIADSLTFAHERKYMIIKDYITGQIESHKLSLDHISKNPESPDKKHIPSLRSTLIDLQSQIKAISKTEVLYVAQAVEPKQLGNHLALLTWLVIISFLSALLIFVPYILISKNVFTKNDLND